MKQVNLNSTCLIFRQIQMVVGWDFLNYSCSGTQVAVGFKEDGSIDCKPIVCPRPSVQNAYSNWSPSENSGRIECKCNKDRADARPGRQNCGSIDWTNYSSSYSVDDGCGTGTNCSIQECHLFAIVATDMLASGAMKPTIVFVGVAAKERVAMQLMEVGHHGLPVLLVVAEGQCIGIVIARIRLVAGVLASVPVLRRAIRRRVRRNRKCRVGKVIFKYESKNPIILQSTIWNVAGRSDDWCWYVGNSIAWCS